MTTKTKKGVDTLVEEIGNLTVLELSELVKALQDKFGVSAASLRQPVQMLPNRRLRKRKNSR
jgi:ribosomal protein L7/L12